MLRLKISPLFLLLCSLLSFASFSQAPHRYNSSEIQLELNKLSVLGSALYIAAHPDDENNRLITWLANEKLVKTGYMALTRGDGGQNLIGPEISEYLGVIRTQELLQARKIDGGQQFFSRANDFGFSKNPDETFTIWDRNKVLSDVVWVIRKFKPDVIITRFSTEPGGTHGHHTASAILAQEAFEAAGDKTKFPEQLKYVSVWQPKRLLWNTSWWFYGDEKNFDKSGLLTIDVGGYNPLLGESYTEIAAESRSMHKSQGFGSSLERGSTIEYLKPIKGSTDTQDLFSGIDLGWSRIEGGKPIGEAVQRCIADFNPENPAEIVPELVNIYQKISKLKDSKWKATKLDETKALIRACLGLYLEATAGTNTSAPGEKVTVNIEAVNRSSVPVKILKLGNNLSTSDTSVIKELDYNKPLRFNVQLELPDNMDYTQPYWLREKGTVGMFSVTDQQHIGMPEDSAAVRYSLVTDVLGETFSFKTPLVYKSTDPVKGEQYQPFEVRTAGCYGFGGKSLHIPRQ